MTYLVAFAVTLTACQPLGAEAPVTTTTVQATTTTVDPTTTTSTTTTTLPPTTTMTEPEDPWIPVPWGYGPGKGIGEIVYQYTVGVEETEYTKSLIAGLPMVESAYEGEFGVWWLPIYFGDDAFGERIVQTYRISGGPSNTVYVTTTESGGWMPFDPFTPQAEQQLVARNVPPTEFLASLEPDQLYVVELTTKRVYLLPIEEFCDLIGKELESCERLVRLEMETVAINANILEAISGQSVEAWVERDPPLFPVWFYIAVEHLRP